MIELCFLYIICHDVYYVMLVCLLLLTTLACILIHVIIHTLDMVLCLHTLSTTPWVHTVITYFWVTPKSFFLFFFLKKIARCRFERHCATSSPLQMQRQGRRGFLKFFPLFFPSLSPPHLPKNPAWPIPTPTQPYPATPMPPCPALGQGMVNLSPGCL